MQYRHVTLVLVLGACKSQEGSDVRQDRDFVFNPNARNFAILAGADGSKIDSFLGGVATDIDNWWKFLCPNKAVETVQPGTAGVVCEGGMLGKFEVVYADRSHASVSGLTSAMTYVGGQIEDDSTVLLAYSGHGSDAGTLFLESEDQAQGRAGADWKPFGDALGTASKGRGKRAARFYFFNDSCFSGKLLDTQANAVTMLGSMSASLEDGQILTPAVADGYTGTEPQAQAQAGLTLTQDNQVVNPLATTAAANATALGRAIAPLAEQGKDQNPLFAQAIIFAAANSAQTAGDDGASIGGTFTAAVKKVFEHYKGQHRAGEDPTNPSLQRVFNSVARIVRANVKKDDQGKEQYQTPQYRVTPACVLQEKFFATGKDPVCKDGAAVGSGTGTGTGTMPGTGTGTGVTTTPPATATSTGATATLPGEGPPMGTDQGEPMAP